jgi:hypothetical protein
VTPQPAHRARSGRVVTSSPPRSRTARSRACPTAAAAGRSPGRPACGPAPAWPPQCRRPGSSSIPPGSPRLPRRGRGQLVLHSGTPKLPAQPASGQHPGPGTGPTQITASACQAPGHSGPGPASARCRRPSSGHADILHRTGQRREQAKTMGILCAAEHLAGDITACTPRSRPSPHASATTKNKSVRSNARPHGWLTRTECINRPIEKSRNIGQLIV